METSESSDLDALRAFRRVRRRRHNAAFSLVEIALALGILAFSLVSVFGLIPLGLASFRKATDISIGSQISQVVIGEAQQTDFDALIAGQPPNGLPNPSGSFDKPVRYFDYQGNEETSAQSGATLYWVNTRIVPASFVPDTTNSTGVTANQDIATVTIQVATNPGNRSLVPDQITFLWPPMSGVPTMTFSTYVARNSPPITH